MVRSRPRYRACSARPEQGAGRRPAAPAAAGAACIGSVVLAAALGLSGCGKVAHRAVPPPTTVPVTTPVTTPSLDTPPGARLAIGTAQGMEIWSAATGVFTVGPALRGVVVSDIAWSSDGRVLSWQTVAGSHRHGAELWYADVATGATRHWGPLPRGDNYGSVIATDAGVLTLGPVVTRYSALGGPGGTAVAVPAVVPPPASATESWDGGWVVEPAGSPTGQRLGRIAATGAAVPPAIVLDAGTSHGPYFDLEAVDRSGNLLAAELGTHGTACEASGTAQMWMADLSTGAVTYSTPPSPGRGRTERFWDIDVSGPPGTIYASTVQCGPKGRRHGQVVSTLLWRFRRDGWHRVGANLVAADRAAGGPLATLRGDVRIVHGVAVVTGPGTVVVAGRAVATGGQALAWDPVRDVPSAHALATGGSSEADAAP